MNPEYRTQGKCNLCKTRHTWPEIKGRLKDAQCPNCGNKLERTTYLSKLPIKDHPFGLPSYPNIKHCHGGNNP